jgi:hypothetical protein
VTSKRVPGGVVHKLPVDLREALIANATALAAWIDITPLARNEFICWVEDAKQETTRKRRIKNMIATPLENLTERIREEILKRESQDALVPLDRDAVPPEYADQVSEYYRLLGSGQ